jgi:hypothetical protein
VTVPPYVEGRDGTGRGRLRVDAARLWTGGLATALVAALVAVVGVLIARGLFDVPVLAPFMTDAELATKVATAAIALVIGMAIGSLVSGAARSATRLGRQGHRLPER